jgi:predicted MFS family arabinose efflux permease
MGFVFAPLFDVVLAGVSDDEIGSASGVLNAVQQFAASIGVALLGSVFLDRFAAGHSAASAVTAALVASIGLLALRLRQGRKTWQRTPSCDDEHSPYWPPLSLP